MRGVQQRWIVFFVLGWAALSTGATTTVYRHQDENGTVVFSDQAHHPKAVRWQLGSEHHVTKPVGASSLHMLPPKKAEKGPVQALGVTHALPSQAVFAGYQQFELLAPTNGQTLWNQSRIQFSVAIAPQLRAEDKLVVALNGQVVRAEFQEGHWWIPRQNRGTYQLQLQVVDHQGRVLATTSPVTLYIKHSVRR